MLQVIPFIYDKEDELLANTYVIVDSKSKCVVVDPGSNYDGIINFIKKNNYKLVAVLLTHAHFDHIGGVDRLLNVYEVPAYAGYEEIPSFKDPYLNCSKDFSIKGITVEHDITSLGDNEILHLLEEDIKVIYTPYHTIGSVCYYFDKSKLLFSGDSLFAYTFGRSDLPTSVPSKMHESIDKLMKLDDEVKVYPGHGRTITIGQEKSFLKHYRY